jgi:hypothetical protein
LWLAVSVQKCNSETSAETASGISIHQSGNIKITILDAGDECFLPGLITDK